MLRTATILVIALASSLHCEGQGLSDDGMHPKLLSKAGILPETRVNQQELDSEFWLDKGQAILQSKMKPLNLNTAKNVILFLGDGMSVPTITATRSLAGERNGLTSGEGIPLSFEKFPFSGLSQTYCVDYKVADSACSATAYLGGVKGNEGTIGVTARVLRGDCEAMRNESNYVQSIAKWFQDKNLATGLVTTARVTHASPAGVFAHTADRDWESDRDVINHDQDPTRCDDIALQLVQNEPGKNLNVVLGGGRSGFLPESSGGVRKDGRDLISEWISNKNETSLNVSTKEELLSIEEIPTNLFGLFGNDHLDDHWKNNTKQPTLAEMTKAAIDVLNNTGKGYFLFVEGAKIDMGHHANQANIALDEAIEFAKAVELARNITSEEDTLIVVTADHAHTMTFSGYTSRDNSVIGFGGTGSDSKPYIALSYANGPGFKIQNGQRPDLSNDDIGKSDYIFPSGVPLGSETHGGDDVAVFASGPWAHIFSGSYEENYIPHAMAFASCVGSGSTVCSQ